MVSVVEYDTIHNTHKGRAKCEMQNNMSYAKAHACILVPWSSWAIINAVGHSLSAQSLISAKEEGERPLPPPPALPC